MIFAHPAGGAALPEVFDVADNGGDQSVSLAGGAQTEFYLAFVAAQLFNLACIRGPSPSKNSSTAILVRACSSGS